MKKESKSMITIFFDNIEIFNKKAIILIKNGEIEKAIETYKKKIDYIIYAYEYDLISFERALNMTSDTHRLIDILS